MRIPGFGRSERRSVDDSEYLERRPGETQAEFDARMSAAAAARGGDVPPAAAADARREAYVEGRREGRRDTHDLRAERAAERREADREREARRREHARRHRGGLGLFGVMVALVAVIGVLWLVLAARQGSFAGGGAVVDQKIAQVTTPARQAVNNTVDRTGQAVQNAGKALEDQGDRIRQAAR
jgi:hypothetical protein